MSLTPERFAALKAFAEAQLGTLDREPVSASSDASFRSYWRVSHHGRTAVVMNAPPDKENTRPFLDVARRLSAAGIRAPDVLGSDQARGFLLLEDFGSAILLPALSDATVEEHYSRALDTLLRMQLGASVEALPNYDSRRLIEEMQLFETWFLRRHLGLELSCDDSDRIEACMASLVGSALEQPQTFVHRDYHSRNLMLLENDLGVIDFQDALCGPITYDLVSLLKDCYIQWPLARVYAWADDYRQRAAAAGLVSVGQTRWRRWFDWMGLQRHLKVLGIFCRLYYRDGKAGYLNDLPLVLDYTLAVCERYGELAGFGQWLESRCAPAQSRLAQPNR